MEFDYLNEVVNVTIENTTGNINTTDLNTIMIMSKDVGLTAVEKFRYFTDAQQVKAAGFKDKSYTYKAAQLAFSQRSKPERILVSRAIKEDDYIKCFEEMLMIDEGWLWLVTDLRDASKQLELAMAVNTTERFYVAATSDPNALVQDNEDHIGFMVKERQLTQTYCWFGDIDKDLEDYGADEIALLAVAGGRVAGTAQFKLKQLTGVIPPKAITDRSHAPQLEKGGYTFCAKINKKTYSYGSAKLGSGEWIDVGLAITWIRVGIREDVFDTIASPRDKLGMSNTGAASIEATIRRRLVIGQNIGIISKEAPINVSVPDVSKLGKIRATRILPDVRFSAQLLGAIIGTKINGEVWE